MKKKRISEERMKELVSRYLEHKGAQFREHLEAYAEAFMYRLRLDAADYIQRLYRDGEDGE